MRILYCNKYNFRFSGTETYLFETIDLMRARGHDVALFSMVDPRGQATVYDQHFASAVDFKNGGLATRARQVARAIYSAHARKQIKGMIKDFRPDVAHVRNIYHHLSPSILWELKAQGIPVVYHLNDMKLVCPTYNMVGAQGQACERCKGGRFWQVLAEGCYAGGRGAASVLALEAYVHRWLKTYEKCADLLLAPSEFVKQKLLENGWPSCKIRVLPHFQQVPEITPPHPGRDAPILYFGRLSAEKGVSDVISAVAQIPDVRLIIAGTGSLRAELEALASDRTEKNVQFVGQLSESALDELIGRSQFTVFPSHAYETLGKSILESYAQGRAVVASDLGSRRGLVEEGKTGLLYQVGNITQLSAAIQFLQDRPELARGMGEAGHEFVRRQHDPERHLSALTEIYETVANKRKSALLTWNASPTVSFKRSNSGPPLKIAYIGGRGLVGKYSGIETYYEETGKRLAELGHEVTIYCRTRFTPDIQQHNGMRIVRLPTIPSKHLETLIHTALSTAHACFSGYDLVHYHALGPSLFSFLPRLLGKKTLVTVQGLDWQRKKWSWVARSVLRAAEWGSARLPNCTVVVSKTLQKRFLARYGNCCVYIPNGTQLRERTSGTYLAQRALVAKQYVLFLGRFSPEKNCTLLIDAFENVASSMKLVLAGGSSYTDAYTESLRQRQSDAIKILDWVSDDPLQELLTNAALFVLPSEMEGLSLSLLEAMGAGLCVLASDIPENRELIADCGFTFRAGDAGDLTRMLSFLLKDAALRGRTGKKARARIEKNYLWDHVTKRIEVTYREVLAGSRPIAESSPAVLKKTA